MEFVGLSWSSCIPAILIEMQIRRNEADYSGESIGKKKAAELLRRSTEIVSEISKEIIKL